MPFKAKTSLEFGLELVSMQYNVYSVVHSLIFTKHFILVRITVDPQPIAGQSAMRWEYFYTL